MDASEDVLLRWLMLLGWSVEISHDGEVFVAVARHYDDRRGDLVAGAIAACADELPLAIFAAALARFERGRTSPDSHLLVA